MSELINGRTPEEIITGLKCEVPCSKCAYRDHNFMKDDSCSYFVEQDILALIEHLESERDAALAKVPKWISVKERLPEFDVWVAVWYMDKYGDYFPTVGAYRDGGDGLTYWETDVDMSERAYPPEKITHWMPLPEPPTK